jgi:hypothetical protein
LYVDRLAIAWFSKDYKRKNHRIGRYTDIIKPFEGNRMGRKIALQSVLLVVFLAGCQASSPPAAPSATPAQTAVASGTPAPGAITFPKIDRRPAAAEYQRDGLASMPSYDSESGEQWQVDLRSFDLSRLDLRGSLDDLMHASFDDRTVWPSADKMPEGFDWKQIMELGKNPGLGLRELHEQGIRGANVGIAIIDQTLLVTHPEYAGRLRLYEEFRDMKLGKPGASMHGPAVASIAVGENLGVAPGADLYFIASGMCNTGTLESVDFACLAESVMRILEVNRQLPPDRKIRVLSMAIGWGPEAKGYAEITAAVHAAREEGLFVICSSEQDIYGFHFHGLGRHPLADPDVFTSYEPGSWWAEGFYQDPPLADTLLIPMDSRTTASPTGAEDYVFYREGGWSWSIPYIAGMYALAAQVKSDVTPELFWSTALQTGQTIEISHEGQTYSFGVILDPAALIRALQES